MHICLIYVLSSFRVAEYFRCYSHGFNEIESLERKLMSFPPPFRHRITAKIELDWNHINDSFMKTVLLSSNHKPALVDVFKPTSSAFVILKPHIWCTSSCKSCTYLMRKRRFSLSYCPIHNYLYIWNLNWSDDIYSKYYGYNVTSQYKLIRRR